VWISCGHGYTQDKFAMMKEVELTHILSLFWAQTQAESAYMLMWYCMAQTKLGQIIGHKSTIYRRRLTGRVYF